MMMDFTDALEAFEARLETRLMSIDNKLDRLTDSVGNKLDRLADRVEIGIDTTKEAKAAASMVKWNILFTALGAIGLVIAVFAVWP